MGMSVSSGGSGDGRRRGRRSGGDAGPVAEINVTPLVDVMLVLLIVFMIAAPLMTVGVPLELPKTTAQAMQPDRKPMMISITPDGEIFIDKQPIAMDALVSTVSAQAEAGTEERIYLRGDTTAQYGKVMEVMGALSGAGYAHIGLVTEQKQQAD